jgi:hypothetical protein
LRQTEGFVRSIVAVMRGGLDAPDHTTLSRRGQSLDVAVRYVATRLHSVMIRRTKAAFIEPMLLLKTERSRVTPIP